MKITILSSFIVLGSLHAGAQETDNAVVTPKYAIKVYNSFGYQNSVRYNGVGLGSTTHRLKDMTLLKPSIAFMWNDKKGNSREIELSSFSINRRDDRSYSGNVSISGMKMMTTDISLRYESIINFAKKKDWKLKPSLGTGLNPYVLVDRYIPYTSTSYPRTDQRYGLRAYVAPRLNYNVSKRVFIDLNIPITVAAMEFAHQKDLAPVLGGNAGYGTANFEAFPMQISARLGVGIRL